MSIAHTSPAYMQPKPTAITSEYVMQQVRLWEASAAVPGVPYLVNTQSAMQIAAWWQSPGTDGIGMARFASTGAVTSALFDAIARGLKYVQSRREHPGSRERNLSALRALDAYVRAATVPVWAVGSNTAGYLPDSDVSPFLDYADAVEHFRSEVSEAPDALTDESDGGDCSADGPCGLQDVPDDFPVRPLATNDAATDRGTCGECGRSWDDAIATSYTPAPSARCPFEYFHGTENCEFHDLDGQVRAYLADDVPWVITPSVYAVNPHQGEPRELSITLRPESCAIGTVYWLNRAEMTVAEYLAASEAS